MGQRSIRVIPEWRPEPDLRLYVLALIALARQLQEEEEASKPQPRKPEEGHDD